jgi:PAS domain S-box-containing protein
VTLRSIGDGVIATDIHGKVILMNKVAELLTGRQQEKSLGLAIEEVFHTIDEKTEERCTSPVQQILALDGVTREINQAILIAADGSRKVIAESAAPIRDRNSVPVGVVSVFKDITNEQRLEEELLKIQKLKAVGVLAGGIAHDFNNILFAILGNIELVDFRIAGRDDKATSLLREARKATKRAAKLTQQLLTFSKGGDPVRESILLPELISDSADFVLRGSMIFCEYNFSEDLWPVNIDGGQISQVIQNIIINANHAMPEGGRINITCTNVEDPASEPIVSAHKGDFVRITIEDTGIGIPHEILHKIFDPYFSTKSNGSGLGLAICHSIINKHDGYLTVDSTPGKGTRFTLYLPAVPSAHIHKEEQQEPVLVAETSARIMVMDDEEILRDVAGAQLQAMGHEHVLVADGAEALVTYQEQQAKGCPVDIVIMDLTIPGGMGGQEAAQKLLEINPAAKIIVASGYSNDPVMANCRDYGFSASIAKPFEMKELFTTLNEVLKQ